MMTEVEGCASSSSSAIGRVGGKMAKEVEAIVSLSNKL